METASRMDTRIWEGRYENENEKDVLTIQSNNIDRYIGTRFPKKNTLFTLFSLLRYSDVSYHFFWSEYRVNRTRFHELSSEFSLYWC